MQPQVVGYRTPVRASAPQAVAIALGLGWLYGKAIRPGQNGATRYGYPSISTQRAKYAGYVTPPQIFTGYSARRVAAGSVRATQAAYPSTSTPAAAAASPLSRTLQMVGNDQMARGHAG
jgi:hypothetical protein